MPKFSTTQPPSLLDSIYFEHTEYNIQFIKLVLVITCMGR